MSAPISTLKERYVIRPGLYESMLTPSYLISMRLNGHVVLGFAFSPASPRASVLDTIVSGADCCAAPQDRFDQLLREAVRG